MKFSQPLYLKSSPVNKAFKTFLVKLLSLIIGWELLYYLFLKPLRIPDRWLTDLMTIAVTACINCFFKPLTNATWVANARSDANNIEIAGRTVLQIFDGCNGLDLILIYAGFIILLPSTLQRKAVFLAGGIVAIMIANIIRCTLLYWVYLHYRSAFEINHHYVFTFIMYILIFAGWALFTKKRTS